MNTSVNKLTFCLSKFILTKLNLSIAPLSVLGRLNIIRSCIHTHYKKKINYSKLSKISVLLYCLNNN